MDSEMKAVILKKSGPEDLEGTLVDRELPLPEVTGKDLLVRVKAVAVNPVDVKSRKRFLVQEPSEKVLGYDAAGVVEAIGPEVKGFRPGDEVYYAGDISRAGSNAQYQVVDERIVAHKPNSLNFEQAAALPLTSITAYEALFDRLKLSQTNTKSQPETLLIIGGAGGVGSIAIQLAKQLSDAHVVATASRESTQAWCRQLGADAVISHHEPILAQFQQQSIPTPTAILNCNDTDSHWAGMAELIRPQGRICAIVENYQPMDMSLIRSKSITFSWELMFTRSLFQTPDMNEQHHLLEKVALLVDTGKIRGTQSESYGELNAENLQRAHEQIQRGSTMGKITLHVP